MAKKKADAKTAAVEPEPEDFRPRLSNHPRAQRQIREAKAWAGIVGFVLIGLLSLQSGQPLFDAGIRALVAGVGCYMAGWAMAVLIWRHLARAEVQIAEQRIAAEQAAAQ
jgi:protein-S-isoprenylcysteine O-methyltransferase Ste14